MTNSVSKRIESFLYRHFMIIFAVGILGGFGLMIGGSILQDVLLADSMSCEQLQFMANRDKSTVFFVEKYVERCIK